MLDEAGTRIGEERNSRKEPLSDEEAQELLDSVSKVIVAKGKRFNEMPAAEAELDHLKGPTGNYRAPMVRKGKTLLVGFHPETLQSLV